MRKDREHKGDGVGAMSCQRSFAAVQRRMVKCGVSGSVLHADLGESRLEAWSQRPFRNPQRTSFASEQVKGYN